VRSERSAVGRRARAGGNRAGAGVWSPSAVAGLWRTRPTEPDTLAPALDAARREAHSHWEQLTALLAQAGFTVEAASANGAPDAHAHETLQRLQHALHHYSERWNALQQRLAEQKRLRDQRDALHHLAPDPKALRDRLRELAVQMLGLEEQIRRNPLAQSDLPERELLLLDERVQQERQRLDALREEQLRCEGALQNMPTHEPTDALELEHARALQTAGTTVASRPLAGDCRKPAEARRTRAT
jgi:hypothetical protein